MDIISWSFVESLLWISDCVYAVSVRL